MKNFQNHVNFSKIIILEELMVITHPKIAFQEISKIEPKLRIRCKINRRKQTPHVFVGFVFSWTQKFEVSTFPGTKN